MSWYTTGSENAEKMAASSQNRRTRNFFTRENETATIRFLKPLNESFNYKRAFVKKAKGNKLFTSPGLLPDPFVSAGYTLQPAFAWPIIDRRVLEFNDRVTGESRKVGPRVLYFADGPRTRKQLLAFEREVLNAVNEDREQDGEEPLTLEQFNITDYDIRAQKPKDSPWIFTAKKARPLSEEDKELVEKYTFDLSEELKPLPIEQIKNILGTTESEEDEDETPTAYSYSDEEEDVIKFS